MGRRIAVVAVLAALALGVGPAAQAGTGLPVEIGVDDQFFAPKQAKLGLPIDDVRWRWDADGSGGGTTSTAHNVVSRNRLFESQLQSSGTYELTVSAGTFRYYCALHRRMVGKLRVWPLVAEPAAAAGGAAITWANRGAQTGNRYDVRYRIGKGKWKTSKEDTRKRWAGVPRVGKASKGKRKRAITLQVRSQKGKGEQKRSGWSPKLKVKP